ncbi:scaffoldin [Neocallimastix sp. 'constans']
MLGWKYLRNISLLFLVSRLGISSVSAALVACDSATASEDTACTGVSGDTYCIGSNKIFHSTTDKCEEFKEKGVYLFSCDSTSTKCDLVGSGDIASENTLLVYGIAEGGVATAKDDYTYIANNKLVICTTSGGGCAQKTNPGYYTVGTNTNAAAGTLLIKIEGSTVTPISTVTAGSYYLDESSLSSDVYTNIITCSTTCSSAEATAGVFVNSGTPGVIVCSAEKSCVASPATAGQYYANAGSDSTTKPYIQCAATACTAQVIAEEGIFYYLDQGNYDSTNPGKYTKYLLCKKESSSNTNSCTATAAAASTILLNSGTPKSIITCDANNCSSKPANPGDYYLNSDTNNKFLIECNADRCAKAENPSTVGAYVDSGKTTNIITCDATGCTSAPASTAGYEIDASNKSKIIENTGTTCESKAHQATDTAPKHYLQAASSNPKVITCTSATEGCHYEDASLNGYFVNSGKDFSTKHVIQCVGGTCSEATDPTGTTCTVGKYIIDNGKVKLCISSGTTDAVEIKTGATEQILTLTITADNDFPGTTASSTAHVKLYSDGSVILLENGALATAQSDCNDDTVFKFDSSNKKIQTGTSNNCADITATSVNLSSAGSVVLLFDSDGHQVNVPTSGSIKNVVGYQCTFAGTGSVTLQSCALIKGYAISGSTVVQCSGWKKEGCTIATLSACADGDEGKMGTGNKVCFNTNGTSLPAASATTPSYIGFVSTKVNELYGIFEDAVTFIQLTANGAIITDDASLLTVGFQINAVAKDKTKALIKCESGPTCEAVDALSGFYVNKGKDATTTTNQVLKCSNTGCEPYTIPATATACQENKVGIIYESSAVKLCTGDSTTAVDLTADAYKTLKITEDGVFPDTTTGAKVAVKVSLDGYVALLEEASLPICNSVTATSACTITSGTLADGGHCIKENKIYKADFTANKCEQLAEDATSTKVEGDKVISYFAASDYNVVESTNLATDTEYLVYECTLDSGKKHQDCALVKGFTDIGTKNIKCNGWKGEKCEVITTLAACVAGDNGKVGASSKVCFSATPEENPDLPTGTEVSKIAFNSIDISTAYGALKDDIVFLSLSASKAVVDTTPLGSGERYFINYNGAASSKNQIIHCNGDDCETIASVKGYYVDSGSETVTTTTSRRRGSTPATKTTTSATTSYAKLISCPTDDGVCTSLASASILPGFYIDASSAKTTTQADGTSAVTTYSKLIKCTVEKDENNNNLPPVCTLYPSPKAGFYINAITTTDKFTESLIQCTGEGTNVACQVKTLVEDKDKDSIFINNDTSKLIQCIDKGTNGCKEFASTGTSTVPAFYINGGKAGSFVVPATTRSTETSYEDLLIRCTDRECELAEAGEFKVYLNANLKDTSNGATTDPITNANSGDTTHQLIICSEGKCDPSEDAGTGTATNYYVNGGVDSNATDKTKSALIKCFSSETPKCSLSDVTVATGVTENFYINGNVAKDAVHYLIKCTSNGCEPFTTTNPLAAKDDVEYYVHGAQTAFTDAIIQCTLAEVTAARKREQEEPKKFTSSDCKFVTTPAANQIYINSFNQKLIQCYGTVCEAFSGVLGSATNPAYYVNAASTSSDYTGKLIKCSGSSCEVVNGVENAVYINGNFKDASITSNNPNPNGVTEKRLIICDKTSKKCEPAEVKSEITGISYFVNGNNIEAEVEAENIQRRDVSSLTNALIKCPATASPLKPCETINGVENGVYLNANFDQTNNPNQIIKCTSEGGCIEDVAYADGVTGLIYYVNAGSVENDKLKDTLIKCTTSDAACAIKKDADAEQIYINALDNQLILCYSDKGCVGSITKASDDKNEFYLNSSDLQNAEDKLINDLIKCSISISDDESKTMTKKCEPYKGKDKKVYVNSYNTSQLIYCLEDVGCAVKNSNAIANRPEYYVNGDDIDFEEEEVDSDPLNGDLIECKKNDSGITCSVINGHVGDVYINSNFNTTTIEDSPIGDDTNPLIKCTTDNGCVIAEVENEDEDLPLYYINSGNKAKNKLTEALIKCVKAGEACEILEAKANEIYVNSNENQLEKPIIKCTKNNCSAMPSAATEISKEYYINAGKATDTPLLYDIIECSIKTEEPATPPSKREGNTEKNEVTCKCLNADEVSLGIYMNTNYSESGDNNQLIQCSSDNGCIGVKTVEKGVEYYVNAESADLTNAIIFCSNKKCEKQTPSNINMYYVGKDGDNVDGLIECVETTKSQDPEPETPTEPETPEEPETPAIGGDRRRASGDTVNKCTLKSAFTSQGYYLNSGYNKSTNQTIICDSTEGCSTVKVDLGYYVNAGNDEKKIIKCEKEGSECEEEDTKSCPLAEKAVPGNYCYEDGQLKFFTANNSTAITASKSDDTYAFATIPSNGFPGVKSETGSLFKISRYFINRFYQSGVIMIDKNGKLVDSLGGDTSDISLYDCNESTKVCAERPGCTSNTYMFDSENRKAVFCNDGNLEYASFTGYVVDGNRVTSGTKHPYIIQCENGENCVSLKPKSSTYYENSGYDSTTNSLIQCNNSNCMTVAADVGYYVAHGHIDNNGVIKCTTATSCSYSQVKNKVKYVNAGFDKRNNAIIECKGGKCNVAKAKSGYYLTHTSTLLIQCTSPTSCAEFTPTVNYYDNADSSESSNTIINCVQNSNVVTCSSEATNNGFYMSSLSNVLIRCKAGHKCKTITVKNGIFRGALKGLTSNKRSDNAQNVQNVHGRDDDDLEEDGKMVNLRDNSDDAYGIIRCVAGKCAALSASELAAIPMCEFNNNKCYITLEYAMTKSATTSIAAGNICTNSDRSVFYFATDTVVVKPNVISGVTSTYVYTTTNSNCLEVNDSYNDMYFTVGSNIYTLDQGSVLQFYETGYYFLNVAKNTLVGGNEIDAYNDENVKLYRCNGSSCSIIDKPDANTYYADVNKRILKYNVNNDVFTFAYDKDIICIFANNKCTPNADLKNQEFCITYKGEIVLATTDIKNRETGECYRAGNINNYIYGYSQHLYHMNQFAAEMVDQTGFYIISLSTNTTVVSKNYKNKNNSIVVYGCNLSSCRVYEPDEDTYYYDAQARNILRYKNGVWSSPSTSGYAYIAIDPTNTYVYKFVKKGDEIIIQGKANYGYYYTVDNEMYHCDQEDGECKPIDETGYYFTNAGEVFSCVHDSEGLEATECVKQNCVSGQYYYIDDAYYRCEVSSLLVPVVSRYCSYDDNVVVNFPLALTEEYPDKIKQAVDDIQKNNNSTAIVNRRGKNYLEAVSGIFTNCTYNVEETKSTFDLVCVNNYVRVDEETDEVKICSVEQLGYVECMEDEENPEKCTVSGTISLLKPSFITIIILTLIGTFFQRLF